MADALLSERFKPPETSGLTETGTENHVAFGWLRGVNERAIALELRRKNGNITALGYAWLQKVEFNPSLGVTLWFATEKIVIQGQNLNAQVRDDVRLFDGLIRHKVPWVQESPDSDRFESDERRVIIESISS